ncbi:uncharacterized protein C10orf95 homolog [Orycteropus afer afer]|uniref:Uncharacterized protein C10orf95 homolog n=1 Tax=Orycteropus afer afer TaxID=1230840 RepID=A0A8B6ZR75_ORYAF|nr:uncharacterized protein C10orf95 homolog [Orycteropus afer afer]
MYSYSCLLPWEGLWPPLQPLTYTYMPAPLLPPIQAHNFCSRPPSLSTGEWAAPREFHCFYSPSAPLPAALPLWAFSPAYAAALRPPLPATGYAGQVLESAAAAGKSWAPWADGDSLQAELRWGRVERTLGQGRELPDSVRRELRRVYGTYPRTDVRVTYRGGEFLLQAAPRVGEPEYRVERRVLRRHASSGSNSAGDGRSGGGDSSRGRGGVERGRRKKRKGLS